VVVFAEQDPVLQGPQAVLYQARAELAHQGLHHLDQGLRGRASARIPHRK
jgi:hypothetical protein